ncbi:MAG: type II secretion system minor pseudopilin GspK [gamma proteobacterium symbiont of Bathyaustriella thionipta]|nr:type II secretion system minor pseudopilin GspK [gamma proteobacterium symbiont of Bathyaustriella thionipta]
MKQQGVALITVLAIVAVVTIIAVATMSRQQMDIRYTENMLRYDQMRVLAESLDAWAISTLPANEQDLAAIGLTDSWAEPLQTDTIQQATVHARLTDLQGRLNLNSLLNGTIVQEAAVARMRRLLQRLELDENLLNSILDWMDADSSVRLPGGAEDADYERNKPAGRAANRAFSSPAELLLLQGFDVQSYQRLAPFISALPSDASMNVNTIPRDLLPVLADDMSATDADLLDEQRQEQKFADMSRFLSNQALAGRTVLAAGLGVNSRYFLLRASVTLDRLEMQYSSVIHIDEEKGARVIQRIYGSYEGF